MLLAALNGALLGAFIIILGTALRVPYWQQLAASAIVGLILGHIMYGA